jgi:hypothetical protein
MPGWTNERILMTALGERVDEVGDLARAAIQVSAGFNMYDPHAGIIPATHDSCGSGFSRDSSIRSRLKPFLL